MIETKPWGAIVNRIFGRHWYVDEIEIDTGGYSSRHRHNVNQNTFTVVSGMLIVQTDYATTILEANQGITIPIGIWHRFFCVRKCKAIEFYSSKEPIRLEIQRDVGKLNGLFHSDSFDEFCARRI